MKKYIYLIILLLLFGSIAFPAFSTGNVTLSIDNISGQNGTQIIVPVRVANFSNMISIQGTIEFNPAIVSYYSVEQFGLIGMNGTNIGTSQTSNGKIAFSWYDQNMTGVTKADNSVVFAIVFQLNGSAGQISSLYFSSSVTALEFVNTSLTPLPYTLNSGSVTVTGSSNPANLTIKMDSVSTMSGSQVVVPVRVVNFNNISTIQGTIEFDTTKISYVSVEQFGLIGLNIGSFGISQVSSGKITFSWTDQSGTGQTKTDNSLIFVLRFNAIGVVGQITNINFTNSVTTLEFVDNNLTVLPFNIINGKVNILNTSSQFLTLMIDSVSASSGSQIVVPIRVKHFANIISLQGSIGFDKNIAGFVSVEQFGLTGLDINSFGTTQSANGVITFMWYDNGLIGQTLNDSTIIFTLRFNVSGVGGQHSDIIWQNTPTPIEAINTDLNSIATLQKNGKIEILNSSTGFTLSGVVTYYKTAFTPMNNTTLKLMNGTTVVSTTTTNASGNYIFSNIPNGNYTIDVTTTYPWGGVSATDVLKIKRHIVGLEIFTEPIRISAADVNNSGYITGTDALKIDRRIVGLDAAFAKPNWLIEKPIIGGNNITINNNNLTQNFYMLCTGDVNSTYIPIILK